MSRISSKALALSGLFLLAAGTLACLRGQDPSIPDAPAGPQPQAAESRILREAVGALAGNHLYQTYLNLGLLADARAEGLYDEEDAQKILASLLALLQTLDHQLAQVGTLELNQEDRDGLERIRKLAVLLRRQGEALRAFWKGSDPEVGDRYEKLRQRAWDEISDLLQLEDREQEMVGLLTEALKGRDARVRLQAAQRLAKMGPGAVPAVPALIEALLDRVEGVRTSAAEALVQVGPAAVPALVEALKKDNATLRQLAAQVLGAMGPKAKEAVPALVEALRDARPLVRRNAAVALGQMGPEARHAIAELEKCLRDRDLVLRTHAAAALQVIRGE